MTTMCRAFLKMRESGIKGCSESILVQMDVMYPTGDTDYMYIEELYEDRSFRWNELPINRDNRGTSSDYFAGNCQVTTMSLRKSLVKGSILKFHSNYLG